jgi:23S rRNA (uracil1939-C5)-methyltransferase
MAGALVDEALLGISGQKAVDLYSGAGLFAARLAGQFGEVTCVESDAVSLEAARGNLPAGTGRFVPTDVETWALAAAARARRGEASRFDWVLADPPRSGLSPATREWLKGADIGGFIYVSCDHVTMARDIGDLTRAGWSLESLTLYDFYPQTGYIEALGRLKPPGNAK